MEQFELGIDDVRLVPAGTQYDPEQWVRCMTYKVRADTDLGGRTDLELMLLHRRQEES